MTQISNIDLKEMYTFYYYKLCRRKSIAALFVLTLTENKPISMNSRIDKRTVKYLYNSIVSSNKIKLLINTTT